MAEEVKKGGIIVKAAEKLESAFDGLDVAKVAKKTVVVPVKWLVIGVAGLLFLAIAVNLSHRTEPYVNSLLGDPAAVVKKK